MNISPVSARPGLPAIPKFGSKPKTPFAEIKKNLSAPLSIEIPKSITDIQQRLIDGASIKPSTLIGVQIEMHRFNLKVELASKGVESLTSSVKRLQQQQ